MSVSILCYLLSTVVCFTTADNYQIFPYISLKLSVPGKFPTITIDIEIFRAVLNSSLH